MAESLGARLMARAWEWFVPRTRWSGRRSVALSLLFWGLSTPLMLRGDARQVRATIDGNSIEALLIGRQKRFRELLRLVIGDTKVQVLRPGASLRHGPKLEQSVADLVAVEVHPWFQSPFARAGWHIVPESIRWRMRLTDFPPIDAGESLHSDLRKIAKHGYQLEVAAYNDQWRRFRDEMLAPLVDRRFGQWAWHPSDQIFCDIERNARLLYACNNGERLGGIVVLPRGKEVWVPFLGVRDGSDALVRSGVIAALYKFTLDWARENGFDEIDFGRTCPFPNDGIARFKRKWGLRPVADALSPRYAMRLGTQSTSLADAFAHQPVYCFDPVEVRRPSLLGGTRLVTFRGSGGITPAPLV